MSWSAEHVTHVPIKVQVVMEHTLTEAISTEFTSAITILVVDHAFFLENCQEPENLFVNVANAESAQFGRKVREIELKLRIYAARPAYYS